MLLMVMYFYAVLGMEIYGGKLVVDNPDLAGSPFCHASPLPPANVSRTERVPAPLYPFLFTHHPTSPRFPRRH